LYVTGDKDEVVPFQQTLLLHKKSTKSIRKEIYVVSGGKHMNSWRMGGNTYWKKVVDFMKFCMENEGVELPKDEKAKAHFADT